MRRNKEKWKKLKLIANIVEFLGAMLSRLIRIVEEYKENEV